jgi:arsenate reductase
MHPAASARTVHRFSAGSHPAGKVNCYALDCSRLNINDGLRSKDWEEFAQSGAPEMDFVFTVCDKAASEVCPVWPGQPMSAHWGFPDPAHFEGPEPERRALFADVYGQIHNRLSIFVSLPLTSLDRLSLKKRLDELGQRAPQPA